MMHPYLVHVERENIRDYVLLVTPASGRAMDVRYWQANHVKIDEHLGNEQEARLETWYCRNLVEAEILAYDLAKTVPGRAVYVTELKSVAQTGATPPTVSNYTEKGLVPR